MVADDFSADLECDRDVPPVHDEVERHEDTSGPPFQRKTYNNDVSVKDRPPKSSIEVERPHSSSSNTKRSLSALLNG